MFFDWPLRMTVWTVLMIIGMALQATFAGEGAQPAGSPSRGADHFVMGAWFAWERSGGLGEYRGVDRWQDVTDRLDRLAENSVETIWVVNLLEEDFPRLIHECEKRKMSLIPALTTVEPRSWASDHKGKEQAYCDSVVQRVVKMAGDSKAVIGWALADEPSDDALMNVEMMRATFESIDPERFCVTVNMWTQIPKLNARTPNLPIYCVDLYPFYGANSVSGPHTDVTSQAFFRSNSDLLVSSAGAARNAWIMGQCYAEARGPHRYDDHGNMIALPGAYVIWRCPTLAEMRWQVWETVRSGADGSIIFLASPHVPDPATAALPPANGEAAWKDVLVTQPTDIGPTALTTPDAHATEQLKELGRNYRILRPYSDIMLRWRPQSAVKFRIAAPVAAASFVDPANGGQYLVLVNDDLHSSTEARFRLPSPFKTARALTDAGGPAAKANPGDIVVPLDAGAGAILRLAR